MIGADRIFSQASLYAVLVAVGCCSPVAALACLGPSYERTIIFNHVPTDVDAPVIAEVTTIDMTPHANDASYAAGEAVVNATVENVIKGQIGRGALRIVTSLTDCNKGVGAGVHGFVAGELRRDAQGHLELVAISVNIRRAIARPQ